MTTNGKLILPTAGGEHWKTRAVRETGGNKTMMGCFALAILGLQHGITPPRFGSTAKIDAQGIVYSNMQTKDGKMYRNHCLGPVQDIIDSFRGLADHLKLNDVERQAMMDELKKWFIHDARANQTNEERGLLQ
jgi:hypothetical protein